MKKCFLTLFAVAMLGMLVVPSVPASAAEPSAGIDPKVAVAMAFASLPQEGELLVKFEAPDGMDPIDAVRAAFATPSSARSDCGCGADCDCPPGACPNCGKAVTLLYSGARIEEVRPVLRDLLGDREYVSVILEVKNGIAKVSATTSDVYPPLAKYLGTAELDLVPLSTAPVKADAVDADHVCPTCGKYVNTVNREAGGSHSHYCDHAGTKFASMAANEWWHENPGASSSFVVAPAKSYLLGTSDCPDGKCPAPGRTVRVGSSGKVATYATSSYTESAGAGVGSGRARGIVRRIVTAPFRLLKRGAGAVGGGGGCASCGR